MVNSYEKVLEGQGYDDVISQWKDMAGSTTPKSLIPSIYMGFLLTGLVVSLISVGAARFAKMEKTGDDNTSSSIGGDSLYDKSESNNKDN